MHTILAAEQARLRHDDLRREADHRRRGGAWRAARRTTRRGR